MIQAGLPARREPGERWGVSRNSCNTLLLGGRRMIKITESRRALPRRDTSMTRPGVPRLRLVIRPGRDDEPRSLVVGRYQALADGSGCLCFPLPDQTCLLQSLQKTKKRIGKII